MAAGGDEDLRAGRRRAVAIVVRGGGHGGGSPLLRRRGCLLPPAASPLVLLEDGHERRHGLLRGPRELRRQGSERKRGRRRQRSFVVFSFPSERRPLPPGARRPHPIKQPPEVQGSLRVPAAPAGSLAPAFHRAGFEPVVAVRQSDDGSGGVAHGSVVSNKKIFESFHEAAGHVARLRGFDRRVDEPLLFLFCE